MQTILRSMKQLSLLLGVALVISVPVKANDVDPRIVYRQKVMQAIGGNTAAIATILKNKLPHEANINTHAQQLSLASTLIESAFEDETADGETDSKPDIWKDWDKFVAATEAMAEESSKLAETARSGDTAAIEAQMKAMGKSCGRCHKRFRKPKEESYKRPR